MDIWTEQLSRRHLSLLERWIGRGDGALTPNDLPSNTEELEAWFELCVAEQGRLDCLALVYETPVGLAGLRSCEAQNRTAVFYLLLGEVIYNPLRTATYVTLRMLDRAFLDNGLSRVIIRVHARFEWFLEVLERMGFSRTAVQDDLITLTVKKNDFLHRKYLF